MIDMNKKYRTRDGQKVRILCVDGYDPIYPVIGLVENQPSPKTWTEAGKYVQNEIDSDPNDLVEDKEGRKIIGWINVYRDGKLGNINETKEVCDAYAKAMGSERFACVPITITCKEGEGL